MVAKGVLLRPTSPCRGLSSGETASAPPTPKAARLEIFLDGFMASIYLASIIGFWKSKCNRLPPLQELVRTSVRLGSAADRDHDGF